jgi:hypothetical protein
VLLPVTLHAWLLNDAVCASPGQNTGLSFAQIAPWRRLLENRSISETPQNVLVRVKVSVDKDRVREGVGEHDGAKRHLNADEKILPAPHVPSHSGFSLAPHFHYKCLTSDHRGTPPSTLNAPQLEVTANARVCEDLIAES